MELMNSHPSPTGIVMLNLGGPASLDEVEPFLIRLFTDHEIIDLPFQNILGPFIAKKRTKKVRERYEKIGGGSPILKWTHLQGEGMVQLLDKLSPETAPHKYYPAFRYAKPYAEDALIQMKADGIKRAVAFSQYPQFSCATSGSSLNDLWRSARLLGMENAFQWSVIDRWPTNPGFVGEISKFIQEGLETYSKEERSRVLILFSAHSLPLAVVNRGDPYPQEVSASVQAVMEDLNFSHEFLVCYQSSVGPVQWMGPSTENMVRWLGRQNRQEVLVVPIAFSCDHIETIHEIDIEIKEIAEKSGVSRFRRIQSLNASPGFVKTLADIVNQHLKTGEICSTQYGLRCPGCSNQECRNVLNPIARRHK